jgi:hypothetical protein
MNRYTVDPELLASARAAARKEGSVSAQLIVWCAVHGNLQLALRHSENQGPSRSLAEAFLRDLGEWLVREGMLTPEILAENERREQPFRPLLKLPIRKKP